MVRIVQRRLDLRLQTPAAILAFLIVCLVLTSAAQSPPTTGFDSIRADELRQKLTYIASEKFKGRGNGTTELNMAAQYIADVFEKNGVKPGGDNGSYFQKFFVYSSQLGLNNELRIANDTSKLKLNVNSDFIPQLWSASGSVTAQLHLVDDRPVTAANLKGKIAVELEDRIFSDDPEFPPIATEGRRLQDAGAVGVIIVQSLSDSSQTRVSNFAEDFRQDLPVRLTAMAGLNVPDYPDVPVVFLSSQAGRQLMTELQKAKANVTATLTVDVERRLHQTQNVLGLIEGSDASLRNEVVIVGAHYDHDGEAFGQIWYGADDNGSGTAALLELAEAMGQGSPRPARSILLSAWAGEEKGLLGSRYYVSHPRFPLNRTAAMFQMDMIGRDEEHSANQSQQIPEEHAQENTNALNVLGTAFSPDLRTLISRANDQVGLLLRFRYDFGAEDLLRRSDQWSFLKKGIPAVFFFAGLHPDYHTPRDTADKINYTKLEKAARLVYQATSGLATSPIRPGFVNANAAAKKAY
jgi:hypothetical protein